MKCTIVLFVAVGMIFISSVPAEPQTFTVLHSFNSRIDGDNPNADLTISGSTIYGMTSSDPNHTNYGTIFSIPVSGGTLTTLFKFDGAHGSTPYGSLTLSGSTLYGMTSAGGVNSTHTGTIFSIPVSGGTPTTLFNFDGTHGGNPHGSLMLDGSTFYGMTLDGGTHQAGTIFSIPMSGGTPTTLFNFDGPHGANPTNNNLTLIGSSLYGMTTYGGPNGYGNIFSIPASGGTPTTLFNFDGPHGINPFGNLTLVGSTFYGMTFGGGTNGLGTIFSIPVSGGTPTTLFNFDGTHGCAPWGGLTLVDSTLYGMTYLGGTNNQGTIFSIPSNGGTPTTLINFDYASTGSSPEGDLTLSGSTLYGMTRFGGTYGCGTIFALTVPEPSTLALLLITALGSLLWKFRKRP
jgi:uncharacterized repeat protein (TIGR03803 family)